MSIVRRRANPEPALAIRADSQELVGLIVVGLMHVEGSPAVPTVQGRQAFQDDVMVGELSGQSMDGFSIHDGGFLTTLSEILPEVTILSEQLIARFDEPDFSGLSPLLNSSISRNRGV